MPNRDLTEIKKRNFPKRRRKQRAKNLLADAKGSLHKPYQEESDTGFSILGLNRWKSMVLGQTSYCVVVIPHYYLFRIRVEFNYNGKL